MSKNLKLMILFITAFWFALNVVACDSDFADTSGKKFTGSGESTEEDSDNDVDPSWVAPRVTEGANSTVTLPEGEVEISKGEIEKLKEKCWFAVSGTWIGVGAYSDTFPNTTSGNPVKHGESFDSVGGVFLEANNVPYEYHQGDREIDKAIDFTFDSIAVAPNMHALIKNASGSTLFDGDGPLIGESAHYANDSDFSGKFYRNLKAKSGNPQWVKNYLNDVSSLPVISLQAARFVKVNAIPDSECDF